MNNVVRLFKSDLARLRGNVITIITILGLVALPSIFSWYNIIACWDVFGNTGNLTVAVANTDEGYESNLVPMRINIGDQITSALRANDQLDWVFTDREDAIDGARSGRYYAAVVIPESFSADMMSFYSDNVEHASITYYSNQKKSAIAPKVTDQGADQVSAQVNKVFAETISEIALNISTKMLDYADQADAGGRIGALAEHATTLSTQLNDAADMVGAYATVLQSAQQLVDSSANLMNKAADVADDAAGAAANTRQTAENAAAGLDGATAALTSAIESEAASYDGLPQSVEDAYASSADAAAQAESIVRNQASFLAALGDDERARALTEAADAVRNSSAAAQDTRAEAARLVTEARSDLDAAKAEYDQALKPALEELSTLAASTSGSISSVADTIASAKAELMGTTGSISQQLSASREKLDDAVTGLGEASDKLADLGAGIMQALASDDVQTLRTIIGSDPEALATAIAAPVQMERHAVYPVENFGSAMSPLYTTLALWIGALLLLVTLRPIPSERTLRELENPTQRQIFIGRFCTIAFISLMQSTVLSVGNLLFLGVQAENPLLYLLCFWVSGLVFAFIIYTLVVLFANLGKALSVILLIVQVSGGGGSFPIKLLPQFFQDMSPFLPITHAVNAMRAAMFGVYLGDFWMELGTLLLFVVPLALVGLVLQKPLSFIVPRFVEKVEKSKLM